MFNRFTSHHVLVDVGRVVSLLLTCVLGTLADAADPIKINGPLVTGGQVDYSGLQFTPDSSRVIYRADQETQLMYELYSASSLGGDVIKLSTGLDPGQFVYDLGIHVSPDSSRATYIADPDGSFRFNLYSVPVSGGTPVPLNGPLATFGQVYPEGIQFIPDSSEVIYLVDQNALGVFELYTVPSGGGTSVKLNGPLTSGGQVNSLGLQFSPDGTRVIYVADQDTDEISEVYSVPSSGGSPVKLNGPLVAGGEVAEYSPRFNFDASRVVYYADQDIAGLRELYSVEPTGGTPVKLNDALVPGESISGFAVSSGSDRVIYTADQDTDEVYELYSVPSTGGTPIKISGALVPGSDVYSARITPDGSRALYYADQGAQTVFDIYSVPIAGGTAVKLNDPLTPGGTTSTVLFTPDSSRVIYRADQETNDVYEIYSVPIAGGTPVKLNGPLVDGGDISFIEPSPDSSRVLYSGDQDTDGVTELYLVPSTGGTPVKLNGALVAGGDVSSWQFSPDGSKVLYMADQDTDGIQEIYVRVVKDRALVGSGNWDSGTSWDQSVNPDEVMQVYVDGASTVTASGSATLRTVNELYIGGGADTSTLNLESDAGINALNGVSILQGGVLRGDGRIDGDVKQLSGELRVATGDTLTLATVTANNDGRIILQGGTLEVDSPLTNAAGGEIVGRGTLVTGGLANQGQMLLSAGLTDVFGTVGLTGGKGGGDIIVSGFGTTTFFDNVDHNGREIRTGAGSAIVFFGDVTGSGPYTGTGDVFYEGTFSPGSSPAAVSIEPDVTFGAAATLAIELGGTLSGDQYDQLLIGGTTTLGGTLDVQTISGFSPSAGDTFDIIVASAIQGTFDVETLPTLGSGMEWIVDYRLDGLSLIVSLPGDGNGDGMVDGLDYLLWAANFGTHPGPDGDVSDGDYNDDGWVDGLDYLTWAANFGAGTATAVPEPTAGVLLMLSGLVGMTCVRGRRRV